jgi:hypothetical protein
MQKDTDSYDDIDTLSRSDMKKLLQDAVETTKTSPPKLRYRKSRKRNKHFKAGVLIGFIMTGVIFYFSPNSKKALETPDEANIQLASEYKEKDMSLGLVDTIALQKHSPSSKEEGIQLVKKLERTARELDYYIPLLPSEKDVHEDGSIAWVGKRYNR